MNTIVIPQIIGYLESFIHFYQYQGSILTFEDTCQVGQVNFYFYLPDTILTCPAKVVIE